MCENFPASGRPSGSAWRELVSRVGSFPLWLLIWLAALAVPFLGWHLVLALALAGWVSALLLAPGRHMGSKLLILALLGLIFWALMLGFLHWLNPANSLRPILNLAAWLALGLNLMLAKTPLALALPLSRKLRPLLGPARSSKLALSLVLLARLIPGLLSSALALKATIDHRAPHLPFRRRLGLWGGALLRSTFSQTDELARALLKRWPWYGPWDSAEKE